jgi:type I restriction enzyme, S subunit
MIESRFPILRFEKIMHRVDRRFSIDDVDEYQCVGVRLYGQGAFIRETKPGALIKRKQQWILRAGDVVYNKLFAWKGTFAIADANVDGCIVSDKFPTYSLDTRVVTPEFLSLWFRSPQLAYEAQLLSKGAAALSKLTLNPPDFWRLPIPAPSVEEQDRIVNRVTAMIRKCEFTISCRARIDAVVQGRRAGIGSEVRLLMTAALRALNEAMRTKLEILDAVLTLRPRSGPSFACSQNGEGIAVIMPSALGGFRFDGSKRLHGFGGEILKEADILSQDDILISRGNKRDQVGLCIVYKNSERVTYANLLMKMRVDRAKALPDFVKYWIMTPLARAYVLQNTKGTSPSIQKINQQALINMPFPANLSLIEQERWVKYLDAIFAKVDSCEALLRAQYQDVERLIPSILSKAFRGEL